MCKSNFFQAIFLLCMAGMGFTGVSASLMSAPRSRHSIPYPWRGATRRRGCITCLYPLVLVAHFLASGGHFSSSEHGSASKVEPMFAVRHHENFVGLYARRISLRGGGGPVVRAMHESFSSSDDKDDDRDNQSEEESGQGSGGDGDADLSGASAIKRILKQGTKTPVKKNKPVAQGKMTATALLAKINAELEATPNPERDRPRQPLPVSIHVLRFSHHEP